jgi:magnesium transporter
VDASQKLVGLVSVCSLIKGSPDEIMSMFISTDIHKVNVNLDQEDVARIFKKYSLISLPVVDNHERLVGMITADEIFDVVEQEVIEDYSGLQGVDTSDFYASASTTSFSRMRWLLVTAFSSAATSFVISRFEHVISEYVCLSALMPVVAAMGGSYALQVNTVMVRALATHELISLNAGRTIFKEFLIALTNSIFFATTIGFISFIWLQDWVLSMVFFAGIFFNMVWGGLSGSVLPILLDKFGLDPALSSGPLVGMSTDIVGFMCFLSLAAAILL